MGGEGRNFGVELQHPAIGVGHGATGLVGIGGGLIDPGAGGGGEPPCPALGIAGFGENAEAILVTEHDDYAAGIGIAAAENGADDALDGGGTQHGLDAQPGLQPGIFHFGISNRDWVGMKRIAAALIGVWVSLGAACGAAWAAPAPQPEKVTFGIDWQAEAAYGGYYEAIATGIYARHGLSVTIRQGGPQVNQAQLLLAGRLDFSLASNSLIALNYVRERLPLVAVAAMFQKDPAVLIAHPGVGDDSLTALRGKPIEISGDTRAGWWNFLRAKFDYSDNQIRPYTFNLQPFLANPGAIQQGYLMDEPYAIEKALRQKPVVLLLADAGFTSYGSLIATTRKLVAKNPDLVGRFVDASIEGWYAYLYGDPKPADQLIMQANPDMTEDVLAYGRQVMRQYGIVDSGDATALGIGAMSQTRWANFAGLMIGQKLYPRGLDYQQAFTLRFVNHRDGMGK